MLTELVSDYLGSCEFVGRASGLYLAKWITVCAKGTYQFYLFQHVSIYFVLHFAAVAAGGAYVSSASALALLLLSVIVSSLLSMAELKIEKIVRNCFDF